MDVRHVQIRIDLFQGDIAGILNLQNFYNFLNQFYDFTKEKVTDILTKFLLLIRNLFSKLSVSHNNLFDKIMSCII